jgi:hypothetical protein
MLVGTGEIRSWLGIEAEDKGPNTKLASLSQAIQGFIENYCGRKFEAKLYATDPEYSYIDGNGKTYIYLPQYPVWYVSDLRVDSDRAWGSGAVISTADIVLYENEGKIVADEGDYFTRGRRNVRIEYYAGYASGTHATQDGSGYISFPVPYDLKQVIIEMVVQANKEGITGVHTLISGDQGDTRMMQMLSGKSMWRQTLNLYKNYSKMQTYDNV